MLVLPCYLELFWDNVAWAFSTVVGLSLLGSTSPCCWYGSNLLWNRGLAANLAATSSTLCLISGYSFDGYPVVGPFNW